LARRKTPRQYQLGLKAVLPLAGGRKAREPTAEKKQDQASLPLPHSNKAISHWRVSPCALNFVQLIFIAHISFIDDKNTLRVAGK
jgi:hypothetical protein